ncbi:MAG: archaellin/type IV pilin N-terminal domain-containing protein [Candidatus Nanoarchaeia archaeon]|jgi:flagellin-like protein
MKMLRKGISPLIATVLIIGFTVALAAIIMTWGTTFSKGIQKSTEATSDERMACAQEVQISLASACVGTNTINMTIKNDGSKDIVNMTARFYTGASAVSTASLPFATGSTVVIPAFGIITPSVTGASMTAPITDATTIKYVEIIPVIKVGEKDVTCSEAVENVGDSTFTDVLDAC